MGQYLFAFLVLLLGSFAFYLLYDRFLKKHDRTTSNAYVEALLNLLDGKHETAFSNLRQVVTEDPANLDAYLRLGQILRDNKKPDKALLIHKDLTLRKNLTIDDKVLILHQLALDYITMNDDDMAEAALKELVTLQTEDRWAYIQLLNVYQKARKWDEAYDIAVKILKLEGNKSKKPLAVFKFKKGEQLYKKQEYHQARIHFKEAIGLDPTYVPSYLLIGDSYSAEKRFEDAVIFWNKLIEAVPDQGHEVIERLKDTLFNLGRFGELAQICENILSHSPTNLEARLTLAEFSEKKGDLDSAAKILLQLVEDYPDNLKCILELVRVYLEKDDKKKIKDLFHRLENQGKKTGQTPRRDGVVDTTLIGLR